VIIARTLEDAMQQAETWDFTAAVIDHALHYGHDIGRLRQIERARHPVHRLQRLQQARGRLC
jgi:hypothetical protein